jgi:hypothetical protein
MSTQRDFIIHGILATGLALQHLEKQCGWNNRGQPCHMRPSVIIIDTESDLGDGARDFAKRMGLCPHVMAHYFWPLRKFNAKLTPLVR